MKDRNSNETNDCNIGFIGRIYRNRVIRILFQQEEKEDSDIESVDISILNQDSNKDWANNKVI